MENTQLGNNPEQSRSEKVREFFVNYAVTIVFISVAVFGFAVSESSTSSFINEVAVRFFRNGLLVLSLIIPVMAGLGLNFGIVIGALAGMLGVIFVRYQFHVSDLAIYEGINSLLLSAAIATPLALLFGYLTGKLYNRTRGQETIASLVVGFFAQGLYLIFVLFIVGGVIPVAQNHTMIIPTTSDRPIGIRAAFDTGLPVEEMMAAGENARDGMTRSLDRLWRIDFMHAVLVLAAVLLIYFIVQRIWASRNPAAKQTPLWYFIMRVSVAGALLGFSIYSTVVIAQWNNLLTRLNAEAQAAAEASGLFHRALRIDQLGGVPTFVVEASSLHQVPVITGLIIVAACLFIAFFTKTKLGQDCRSVGQSQHIANASGINVDRTRIIATMLSTLLAAWGMIIFLQSMGTVSTYNAQQNIGFFAVAALLVGGASASKAAVPNAMFGLVLFHSMFIVTPGIGRYFTGNELVGEYFRSFLAYGVIGVSLGLHAWKTIRAAREKEKLNRKEALLIDQMMKEESAG